MSWSRSSSSRRSRRVTCCSVTLGSRSRRSNEIRRRVSLRRAGEEACTRARLARRRGSRAEDHGGLRRAHARDLQARARGPGAAGGRLRAWARLPGLRDSDGPCGRCDRTRRAPGSDLHHLRRHDARAGRAGLTARGEGPRRRRADGLLAARRARDRAQEPRPRGDLLRDRLRNDGPRDGADAPPRPRATDLATSPPSATTSRSGRRCGRSSTRPDFNWRRSSRRVTSRP